MIDGIFSYKRFKDSIAEMRSIITNYRFGVSKREDIFLEEFDNHFVVIGLSWHNFCPFKDVIYSNQDELVAE